MGKEDRLPVRWTQHNLHRNITTVAVAVGVRGAVLLPEQLQRHALPAQLAMDRPPIGLRPSRLDLGQRRRGRKQPRLQRRIVMPSGSGQDMSADRARCRKSITVVAPIDRLNAILRLDMLAAVSRSTSRILRMGNLAPGMPCSLLKGS